MKKYKHKRAMKVKRPSKKKLRDIYAANYAAGYLKGLASAMSGETMEEGLAKL